jgi:hypothetical protein
MAQISCFMYAANVAKDAGGMKINNPLSAIVPMFIPSTFSFFVVFGVRDFDTKANHTIKVDFVSKSDPNFNAPTTMAAIAPLPDDPNHLPDKFMGFISTIGFQNVILQNEGEYTTVIRFDDEILGEYEICVVKQK